MFYLILLEKPGSTLDPSNRIKIRRSNDDPWLQVCIKFCGYV